MDVVLVSAPGQEISEDPQCHPTGRTRVLLGNLGVHQMRECLTELSRVGDAVTGPIDRPHDGPDLPLGVRVVHESIIEHSYAR
ncbi:hypothetical protein [Virgisporangium aurantiacum]|uniref:Uncharacterized protein n=1 Tax=Virgisporangium aurantiacum TaxID=175570 RepID=A0A8J3ZH60_9ACTN|nr:hypothetical protein [Virgisporangium aurantiacum]GIJ63736.1 hypothetical protein Vau01_112520 [Virgisporangium aurantiacum]